MTAVAKKFNHITEQELTLLKKWQGQGKTVCEMAVLLARDHGTVSRQLRRLSMGKRAKARLARVGRPSKLSTQQVDNLVVKVKELTKVAEAKYQVTVDMLRRCLKLKCCNKVVSKALHNRGIYMHPLREKPVRTPEDVIQRKLFAEKYASKPASFWAKSVDAYIDNKFFPVYLSPSARAYAAKRVARGTYRARGDGLARGHVKPKKNLKYNTGAASVMVSAAVSTKGAIMWHVVAGRWNAAAAVLMYTHHLAPALAKAAPQKRKHVVLEDNDPSGYKSKLAVDAKAALKMTILELPRRSPDLNPLDYGFWSEVSRRMRKQEQRFPAGRREKRVDYLARLRRTATRMPAAYCKKLVMSMKRRCEALREAKGEDFEE